MWPFKKKTIPVVEKISKKELNILYRTERFNVGKTHINVELMDGNIVTILEEGLAYQITESYDPRSYYNPKKPYLGPVTVSLSKERAEHKIQALSLNYFGLSDYRDPTVRYYSLPKKATLSTTEDFFMEIQVGYWEEVNNV